MRHRKAKLTLDRNAAQRQRLFRNLAIALITKERITTTVAKGRATRSMVEKLITVGKKNGLHQRRLIIRDLNDAAAAKKVIETLGPRYQSRPGGYSRLVKLTPRQGDGAERVLVELLPAS